MSNQGNKDQGDIAIIFSRMPIHLRLQKNRKTTQVTKIVTVSDNGKETVKTFNHHNQKINNGDWSQPNHPSINHHQNHKDVKKYSNHGQAISDYDYPANHPAHNQNWKQKMNNL